MHQLVGQKEEDITIKVTYGKLSLMCNCAYLSLQDIGVWFDILSILAKLAVIANAFLIAFTSTFLDEVFYTYISDSADLKGFIQHSYSYSVNNTDIGNQTCR